MPLGSVLQGLIMLAVVLAGSVFVGKLARRVNQPAVVGVIFFGLAMGAMLSLSPASVKAVVLPGSTKSLLEDVGYTGLLLLMFSVGMELRTYSKVGEKAPRWQLVPCVVAPIVIGGIAAFPFAHRLVLPGGNPLLAWLFVGVALSVTAVPVLALIIQDLKVPTHRIPGVALRIAVTTDAVAWALVTALIVATTNLASISVMSLCVGALLLVAVIFVLPRLLERWMSKSDHGSAMVVAMFAYALVGSAATQVFGFHPAIGAVIAGLFFPASLVTESSHRALASVADILIPAFFVSSALAVPIDTMSDLFRLSGLACLIVLSAAAFGSKFAVGLFAGGSHRWSLRTSAQLGALLNCRGVTELGMATVGLQSKLIGPYAFAMLCALALVTTAVTAPLYRALDDRAPARTAPDFGIPVPANA